MEGVNNETVRGFHDLLKKKKLTKDIQIYLPFLPELTRILKPQIINVHHVPVAVYLIPVL